MDAEKIPRVSGIISRCSVVAVPTTPYEEQVKKTEVQFMTIEVGFKTAELHFKIFWSLVRLEMHTQRPPVVPGDCLSAYHDSCAPVIFEEKLDWRASATSAGDNGHLGATILGH